jgi:hypothetical protein
MPWFLDSLNSAGGKHCVTNLIGIRIKSERTFAIIVFHFVKHLLFFEIPITSPSMTKSTAMKKTDGLRLVLIVQALYEL